jgi:hypothetical protein
MANPTASGSQRLRSSGQSFSTLIAKAVLVITARNEMP